MFKLNKFLIVALSIFIIWNVEAYGAVYTCGTDGVNDSCTPSGLTGLLNSASDGDTIFISSGIHSWNSPVTVRKKVTITGGGTCSDCGNADPSGTWDWPTQLNINGNTAFTINVPSSGQLVRISGLFISGNPGGFDYSDGRNDATINIHTNNAAKYRLDNLRFSTTGGWITAFRTNSILAYGVIDHVYYYNTANGGFNRFIHNTGHGGDKGNTDWSIETRWGSENFVYLEDNTLIWTTPNSSTPALVCDQQGGGRIAIRYNYVRNGHIGNHGTESGWPARSGVANETYNNTFVWTNSSNKNFTGHMYRGGAVYGYNNSFTNYQSMVKLWLNRAGGPVAKSPAPGTDPYDGPGPEPPGYPLIDQHGMGQAAGVGLANTQPQARNKSYFWNNTMINTGGGGGCPNVGDSNEISLCNPEYVQEGREYEYSSDDSAAPADYIPYTYPHPLAVPDLKTPAPPINLQIMNN